MKRTPFKIVIFIFHIITILLLLLICLRFDIFHLKENTIYWESISSAFKKIVSNDYVTNILCTIITAVALYIIQIIYSKHKLKNDFRCNEIIHDIFDGIEQNFKLFKSYENVLTEAEDLKKDNNLDFFARQKIEAEKYVDFYNNHKFDFELCYSILTYKNNWILIDSVQTVFFININFKLLNIINNIKNRMPNLEKEYPKIQEYLQKYNEEKDDNTLVKLGFEIEKLIVDMDFMAKYWFSLLNYLGYDPYPVKISKVLFNAKYPSDKDLLEFLKLPVSKQNKITRQIQRQANWEYFKYKVKNFFK